MTNKLLQEVIKNDFSMEIDCIPANKECPATHNMTITKHNCSLRIECSVEVLNYGNLANAPSMQGPEAMIFINPEEADMLIKYHDLIEATQDFCDGYALSMEK